MTAMPMPLASYCKNIHEQSIYEPQVVTHKWEGRVHTGKDREVDQCLSQNNHGRGHDCKMHKCVLNIIKVALDPSK